LTVVADYTGLPAAGEATLTASVRDEAKDLSSMVDRKLAVLGPHNRGRISLAFRSHSFP
jgi:hypothetical protein